LAKSKSKKQAKQREANQVKVTPTVTTTDKVLKWLILSVPLFLPLIFERITYDLFDIPKLTVLRLVVAVAVIVWLTKLLKPGGQIKIGRPELFFGAFLVLAILSTIFSIHPATSLIGKYKRYEGLLTFITYFWLYFVALQTFTDADDVRRVISLMSVAGAIVAFYGLLQYLGLDPIYWGQTPFEARRSFSSFGNPDLLAGYLALVLPASLSAFLEEKRYSWLHGFCFFLISACLVTTYTRGAWIGAIVGLGLFLVLGWRALVKHWARLAAIFGVVLVVIVALVIYSSEIVGLDLIARFKSAFNFSGGTVASRIEIWKAGLAMIKDRPLLGQGLDTYRLASEKYETFRYVKMVNGGTVADNAHNYLVHIAAGGGPLAAFFYFGFFIWLLANVWRYLLREAEESDKLVLVGVITAAISYLVTMLFGISITGGTAPFYALLGVTGGFLLNKTGAYKVFTLKSLQPAAKLGLVIVAALTIVFSALVGLSMFIGDYYYADGLKYSYSPDKNQAVNKLTTAATFYPTNGRIMSQLGQMYIDSATAAAQNNNRKAYDFFITNALIAFKRAVAAEPLEADYKVFLANTYNYIGKNDEAVAVLQDVLSRRKYSLPGNYIMGTVKMEQGAYFEAIAYLKLVEKIYPNYTDVRRRLAEAYSKIGDVKQAAYYRKLASQK
jgi:O-antigen ligase/Flp pilus assembly protein TadD